MAAGGVFELPELITHRIQSFLSSKEAAGTTILSKPWRSAWLTRPDLDFDLNDFDQSWDSFLEFAEKTINRYETSDLRIGSFSLRNVESYCFFGPSPIANMIAVAMKLGATRLNFDTRSWYFLLPNEVLASENLVELSVKGCKIDPGLNPKVGCSMLRSLTLDHVTMDSRVMFVRMISSCPLIEELSLCFMNAFDDGVVGNDLIELRRLRSLVLEYTNLDTVFLNGLSSKFPSLKDLTLRICVRKSEEEMLLISSPSLVRLDLKIQRYAGTGVDVETGQMVKFDVPSIRKLTFQGTVVPSSATRSNSCLGWGSDVFVTHHHRECLSANIFNFLGERLLQGLGVGILKLSPLMNGSNDLVKARAQIFDEAALMWKDVELSADSTVPEGNRSVRFQLIWQPKLN